MKLYHKVFKAREDLTIYLSNPASARAYGEELLERLISARDHDELQEAKYTVLKEFHEIYRFDIKDAEFPEPEGYFANDKEKDEFVKKKILLQDLALYPAHVFGNYHKCILEASGGFPEIEMRKLAIDYNEIYRKAADDYTDALLHSRPHAVAASFMLPSLIEQSLAMDIQNRLIYKSLDALLEKELEIQTLDEAERELISAFVPVKERIRFYAGEEYVMGKLYHLFLKTGVLNRSDENEMILTGRGGRKGKIRTLGSLLHTSFAKQELLPEHFEFLHDIFVRLNIRNCIMHGVGTAFDYLSIGIAAIMFQLLRDIADCEIFID